MDSGVWSVKSEAWTAKCEVWSLKFGVRVVQCVVCCVRCGVSREAHGRDRVSLNVGNFRRRPARVHVKGGYVLQIFFFV